MEVKKITVYDRSDFRKWLRKNHKKERQVGLILYKRHTGNNAPSHRELMDEAICFGWIDTTIKKLDEDRYLRNFTKRTEKSKWSVNTLRYAGDLLRRGKMAKEGKKFYEMGLSKPTHDQGIPKNPDMPDELKKGLARNKIVKDRFDKLAPSKKKMFYLWIITAKLPETKKKRIKKIVSSIREGNEIL